MRLQRSFRMDMMALERLWWRSGGKFQSIQVLVDLQRGSSRKVVKKRRNGRVVGTHLRVIYGDEAEVLQLLGSSISYVERTHLTSRHFNSRLVRKSLGYSKVIEMHRRSAALEDIVYNLVRPLKTLRCEVFDDPVRRWLPRTPAMAAGLTDHIWTVKELLTTLPVPSIRNT